MSHREDHCTRLARALAAEPRIVYVFAANFDGEALAEAGDPAVLPYEGILSICKRPETIRVYCAEIQEYKRTDPRKVPQLLAQGEIKCIIHSPSEGLVVFAFGIMPKESYQGTPEERVAWTSAFRRDIKACVDRAYA